MTPSTPQPDSDGLRAWRGFLVAHRRVTAVLAEELDGDEWLSLTWYDVLVQLSEADDDRLRFQELAEAVLLSASGLSRLIDRMEQAGLVRREPCEDDRRGTYAVMTDRGRDRLVATAPHHLAGVEQHFTGLLSPEEARVMGDVFERVVARLDEAG